MKQKYYKVLDEEGRPFHGGKGRWPLPKNGMPGEWNELHGKQKLSPCHYGLHLCRRQDLLHWLGPTIYEAEYQGELITDSNKVVVRKARLLRQLATWTKRTARLFACDCAERALRQERKRGREPHKASWDALRVARRFANGKATVNELAAAEAAAWAAAWDAAGAAAESWQTNRLFEYLTGKRDAPGVGR